MNGRPTCLLLLALLGLLSGCKREAAPAPASPSERPARAPQASAPAPPTDRTGQLARVRAPAPSCTGVPRASPRLLVSRAEAAFDENDPARALACAEEALRIVPRDLAALHYRAAALAALDRRDEARRAYARALAVDPDDPETLRGAAELYLWDHGADREDLALGLEYALRGARAADRPTHADRELRARLQVLAAGAENDLGDSHAALGHAEAALRALPDDTDAHYERGVALYELCRFAEARASLDRVVKAAPDDAWALHYLALVAERTGQADRAGALEARARQLAPEDFPAPVDLDRDGFELEVRRAIAALPAAERAALAAVPVEVAEEPGLDDLTAVDPPLSPSILGLFRGPPEHEACLPEDGPRCRSIVLFRRNLARYARSRPELDEQVRVTLLHELGHLHGESDDDLRARGLE